MTQVCGPLRLCSVFSTLPKTIQRLIHIEERKPLPMGMYYLVTEEISIAVVKKEYKEHKQGLRGMPELLTGGCC